jgi:predicted DNA-binding transcriptional regulator AlpA
MEPATLLDEALLNGIRVVVREEIRAALKISEPGPLVDRLLDAEEAAKFLCVSKDWLYRNGRRLPFTRKLGAKNLRFSYRGVQEWFERKKLA